LKKNESHRNKKSFAEAKLLNSVLNLEIQD